MPEMEHAGQDVSRGRQPLEVAWISHAPIVVRAGEDTTARVVLRNAGAATWRSRGEAGVRLSYHWLDALRNPFVWDSPRTSFAEPVRPGETVEATVVVRAPIPPGDYVLAFDLVEEFQFWFSEIGQPMLEVPCTVDARIAELRLGIVVHPGPGDEATTWAALARQELPLVDGSPNAVAHLVAGCEPEADWSRRILDAHAEGFAVVGAAIRPPDRLGARHTWSWLGPWRPRDARNPRFRETILLPSLVCGLEPSQLRGWPAFAPLQDVPQDQAETVVFDGRIVVRLRPRSGRRRP